ncbi:MAG: HEAT repeat domain-containing protein [Planctomycetes bacterium]|nr:HEAT repeat domain-containing protein [Planctomycetota bacterium]
MTRHARCASRLAVAALGLTFAGCGADAKDTGPKAPPLPPLQLRPMVPELQAILDAWPQPDEATQRELRDYADVALQLVEADPRTAGRATQDLLENPAAWFVLEPALFHEQLAVRQRAAWLIGQSKQTVLQLPLLLRLKYEPEPEVLVWIADAVQQLGNDTGLIWLDVLITGRPSARESTSPALYTLQNCEQSRRDAIVQQAGTMAIAALQARSVEVPATPSWDDLHRLLTEKGKAWQERGVSDLPDVPAPAPEQLEWRIAAQLLTTQSPQLRPIDDARWILNRLGVPGVPMLVRALVADERYLRTMPLQVLAELGHSAAAAAPAVLPLLADPLTQSYAVRALGEIGATEALPHLRPMLTDRDTELRCASAQAVGLLGDESSRAELQRLMNDQNEVMDVRVDAAFGLLCLGPAAAARAFLDERATKKDYHDAMLTQLEERLAER